MEWEIEISLGPGISFHLGNLYERINLGMAKWFLLWFKDLISLWEVLNPVLETL